jgi:hypothetical protein
VAYQLKLTGQSGCAAGFSSDKDLAGNVETRGVPGPYLEGGQGRFYPLARSEGFFASGGTAGCEGAAPTGAWTSPPPGGNL